MTADGKIAPVGRDFTSFSSEQDQQLLLELRTRADAVMSGARTVEAGKVDLGPGGKAFQERRLENGLAEYNLRVIVSGSASINPKAHIFNQRFSPILILTSKKAPVKTLKMLSKVADDIFVSPGKSLDFKRALEWLGNKWKVKRLLSEGGGEVNAGLFESGLVDELYLTICPVIFGGRTAPTIADGAGISGLGEATQLRLMRVDRVGDEAYCIYKVVRRRGGPKKA